MITVETMSALLQGYSDYCPAGHHLKNLGDLIVPCPHCGIEVSLICRECEEIAKTILDHEYVWPAAEIVPFLARRDYYNQTRGGSGQVH